MSRYTATPIREIGTVVTGKTPSTSEKHYYNGEYMFITPVELHDGYNVACSEKTLTEAGLKSISSNSICGTSVLVGCIGWDMGNVAMCHKKCATNQQINAITKFKPQYNPYYVYYWLSQKKEYLFSIASVTRTPILSKGNFEEVIIPIPSKDIQDSVVDVLKPFDERIAINKRICAELEAMAKTLYDYWFTQFDFPNAEGKPYRSSDGEMVWNDQLKRDIPKGWSCSVIANHIGASKGGDWGKEAPEGNYKNEVVCIRGADFPSINGSKPLNAPVRYILSKNVDKILSSGDIVVEISGGSPTQSTGRICYINDYTLKRFDNDIITSNFCKAFSTKKAPEQYWLYLLWKTLYDAGVLFGFEGKTTGIKNLLFDDFCAQYHIVAPDETVLQKFHEVVSPIFDKIQQYNIENDEFTKLRDWLLPMLMNGQATVMDEKQAEVIPFKNHQVEVKQAARDFNGKQHSDDTEALIKEFMRRKGNDKGT